MRLDESVILLSSLFVLSLKLLLFLDRFIKGFKGVNRVVSSAYIGISLLYITKKSGPRIEPWGTPVVQIYFHCILHIEKISFK